MAESAGYMLRFDTAAALLAAARRLRGQKSLRIIDAYTPYPVDGLSELLHQDARWVPRVALAAAVLAALGAYFMQWYSAVVDYPFVVGGKPLHGWPAFMLVTFACLILAAVLGAVFAMLGGNRLPRLYHPAFNAPGFGRASEDGFFLLVRSDDPEQLRQQQRRLQAADITEAPE